MNRGAIRPLSERQGLNLAGGFSPDGSTLAATISRGRNPNIFLILSGGEPLLRPDLPALAAAGRERGFTVVVGTNGVLLRERQARLLRESGVQGVSLSLDSTDPARHDAFRRLPGAWQGAMRATELCRAEGLDFSLHMSVTEWNAEEIPAMIDLARELPRNSAYYYDFLHYTEPGAAAVAGILDRHLAPWLAQRFPSFRTR